MWMVYGRACRTATAWVPVCVVRKAEGEVMGFYRVRPGSGRPLRGGGQKPEYLHYFGDERANPLIKFSLEDTPRENETLRRARCEQGHVFSVTVTGCPICAMKRAEEVEWARARSLRASLDALRATPGHCQECGNHIARRKRGGSGRHPSKYCSEACRLVQYNVKRRGGVL